MEIHWITLFLPLIPLMIATIEDLRKKEVSDTLNYNMAVFTFFYFILLYLFGILNSSIAKQLIIVSVSFFIIFYLMAKFGMWGGGDVKLLVWLIPYIILMSDTLFLEFLLKILFMFIIGALYSIVYFYYLAMKKVTGSKRKITILLLMVSLVFIALSIKTYPTLVSTLYFLVFVLLSLLNVVINEKVLFIKEVLPEELVEGDWLAEDIKVGGEIVIKKKGEGLSKDDIEKLKKLFGKGKIKSVKIKDGVPFVPAILLWYIFLLLLVYFDKNLLNFLIMFS